MSEVIPPIDQGTKRERERERGNEIARCGLRERAEGRESMREGREFVVTYVNFVCFLLVENNFLVDMQWVMICL
jgi:hypothetical protein